PPIRADDAAVGVSSASAGVTPPIASSAPPVGSAAVFCRADKDCGWDDQCMAKRCVGATPFVGCDKSMPPPGTCTCIDSQCTMKRSGAAPKIVGCKVDGDCGYDAAGGVCRPGLAATSHIADEGALCSCDGGACALEWIGPIACTTSADCSWLESPRRPA